MPRLPLRSSAGPVAAGADKMRSTNCSSGPPSDPVIVYPPPQIHPGISIFPLHKIRYNYVYAKVEKFLKRV